MRPQSTMTAAEKLDYFRAIAEQANAGAAPANESVAEPDAPSDDELCNEAAPEAAGDDVEERLRRAASQGQEQSAQEQFDAIVAEYRAFRDQTGESLVLIRNERVDATPVKSESFVRRLKSNWFRRTGKVPPKTHLELVQDLILERAEHEVRQVHKRVADDGGDIIIDLGDAAGQRIRVASQGWDVEPGGEDVLFRRRKGYGEIEIPETASDAREAWRWLKPLLERVPIQAHVRLVAWLVAAALRKADYPIVLLVGPEGSAKTTLAQSIAAVLDPAHGLLPTISADSAEDIIAGVQGRHVCVLDNAPGKLSGSIEDTLCRISTGAQFEERMLYTNFEVASAELHAPLILTAISHPFRQRDTRHRTIAIEIEALRGGFRRRSDVTDDIDQALGEIRGALLFFISAYLRHRDAILDKETVPHRMVDWAVAGEAIVRELGGAPGKFFGQLERMQQDDANDYLEGDAAGAALLRAVQHWASQAEESEDPPDPAELQDRGWAAVRNAQDEVTINATPTAIQKELAVRARPNLARDDSIPSTARATTGAIQRLQGVLDRAGVHAGLERTKRARFWTFQTNRNALAALGKDARG